MSNSDTRKYFRWYSTGIFSLVIMVLLFVSSVCDNDSTAIPKGLSSYSSPQIPDSLTFCGEHVPTQYFDVAESLERELLVNTFWHSQTILLIKKANRFFPVIEPILKEHGVPDDFKYLAVAESGFANVVSPSGAVGFWQLLEGTAKDYGLEVSEEVDERYHLAKATEVACRYLNESYERYNNWTLCAASYNAGRKGVDRQVSSQKESNYYNLLFSEETARYVYRIIALKLVIEHPSTYNFSINKDELYQPISYKEVTVDSAVPSWADFAHEHHTNYKILKTLNPWLRDQKLINKSGKEYSIYLPKKNARIK
jgi:membrane-bound lytic murein transglycosylase D